MFTDGEYKGHPTITVSQAGGRQFTFGLAKVGAILANLPEVTEWYNDKMKEETMCEVTCHECGQAWMWAHDIPGMSTKPQTPSETLCPSCKEAEQDLSNRYPLAGVELLDLSTIPQLPAISEHTRQQETRKASRECARAAGRSIARRDYVTKMNAPNRWAPRAPIELPATTPRKRSGLKLAAGTMGPVAPKRQAAMFSDKETAGRRHQGNAKLIEHGQPLELKVQDPRTAEEKEADQQKAEQKLNYSLPGMGYKVTEVITGYEPGPIPDGEEIEPEPTPQQDMPTKYVSVVDTAKLVRETLKRFKGIKFSVRSEKYAGGASITVRWTDGPTVGEVDKAVAQYVGSTFDGMQDLKESVYHEVNGELVRYASDYIHTNREYTEQFLTNAINLMAEQYACVRLGDSIKIEVNSYGAHLVSDYSPDGEEARRILLDYLGQRGRFAPDSFWAIGMSDAQHELIEKAGTYLPTLKEVDEVIGKFTELSRHFRRKEGKEAIPADYCLMDRLTNKGEENERTIPEACKLMGFAGFTKPIEWYNDVVSKNEKRAVYQEKREARIDQLEERADKAAAEASQRFDTAHNMGRAIPFGQPILVGHHSEQRDRNYRKRIDTNMRKGVEASRKADNLARRAESARKNRAVSSDDPDAATKLRVKVARLKETQELMKDANKIVRSKKLSNDEKIAKLAELPGISETNAAKLLEPDFAGRIGFASYEFSNNNANIKRLEKRIVQLEAMSELDDVEFMVGDVRVVRDMTANRLQLFFPGKPDAEQIKKLKYNGFRWARSIEAWQRQYNGRAIHSAGCALGVGSDERDEFNAHFFKADSPN